MRDGRANHDYVASRLNSSPWLSVPEKLPPEHRAPDSIQFPLIGMSDDETRPFADAASGRGIKVQVFGLSADNARAFWNWRFLPGNPPALPNTRDMQMRACEVRLHARLKRDELAYIATALLRAVQDVMGPELEYGTGPE